MEDLFNITFEEYAGYTGERTGRFDYYHLEQEKEPNFEEMMVRYAEVADKRHNETEEMVEMIGISIEIALMNQQTSILNLEKQVNQISRALQESSAGKDIFTLDDEDCAREPDEYEGEPICDINGENSDDHLEDEIQRCLDVEWGNDELITDDESDHKAEIKENEELLNKEPNSTVDIPLSGISGELFHSYLLPELPMTLSLHAAKILNKWNFTRRKQISKQFIFLVDFIIKIFGSVNQPFPAFSLDILKIKRGKGNFDIPFDNG